MDEHDRENLNFLMSCTDQAFAEWLEQCDDDDAAYALELIRYAQTELQLEEWSLRDKMMETSEANELLKTFKLKRK